MDRTRPRDASVRSQFARAVCGAGDDLESQEKGEFRRATHPPDLSLGRAASIRTCLVARKQHSAALEISPYRD